MSLVRVRALIVKEWSSIISYVDVWEAPIQPENIESSDKQGFVLPEQMVPSALPLEGLPFLPFIEDINPFVSVKLAMTFYKGNVRQDNIQVPQVPQNPLIVGLI